MNYYDFDKWSQGLKGVEKEYKLEWEALLYKVGGKIFALIGCNNEGKELISLKNEPEINITLRESYPGIIPGYHLNKAHWNSVSLDGDIPEGLMRELFAASYYCVLKGLTKKQRQEIEG